MKKNTLIITLLFIVFGIISNTNAVQAQGIVGSKYIYQKDDGSWVKLFRGMHQGSSGYLWSFILRV